MSISRLATAGTIPGACRTGKRGNWYFQASKELDSWMKRERRQSDFRKAIPRRPRAPRKWERVDAGEKYFSYYLKALEELIGMAIVSEEAYKKHAPYLCFAACKLSTWQQQIARVQEAWDDVERVASPDLFEPREPLTPEG